MNSSHWNVLNGNCASVCHCCLSICPHKYWPANVRCVWTWYCSAYFGWLGNTNLHYTFLRLFVLITYSMYIEERISISSAYFFFSEVSMRHPPSNIWVMKRYLINLLKQVQSSVSVSFQRICICRQPNVNGLKWITATLFASATVVREVQCILLIPWH